MRKVGVLSLFMLVFLSNLVLSMSITVNSPVNGTIYPSSSISVNASCDEVVNWRAYLNGQLELSHNQDNNFRDGLVGLSDNSYTLIISASNSSDNLNNTVIFSVDTTNPIIINQTPADNSKIPRAHTGNISFSLYYTEVNLNYTKLYWKNLGGNYNEESVSGCESGTGKACSKSIDFSSSAFGTNITYYFSLVDLVSRPGSSSPYTFEIIECVVSWSCTSWSSCYSLVQTRTCTDLNNCGNNTSKPIENQSCSCTPNWDCGAWSNTTNSCGTRSCTDKNTCGINTDKPSESRTCDSDSGNTVNQNSGNTGNTGNTPSILSYFLTDAQLSNGSLRTLKTSGDKIIFKVENASHTLELLSIFSNKVSIKVSSSEQYANLTLNEIRRFDLDADNSYEVSITLKRLNSSEADIYLVAINEKVPEISTSNVNVSVTVVNVSVENETVSNINESRRVGITGAFLGMFGGKAVKFPIYFYFIIAIVLLILAAVLLRGMIKKRKLKKLENDRKGYSVLKQKK